MENKLLFLFCLVTLTSISQNKLSEKYNLMPWPKQISETSAKFIINNSITISINGEDKGRVYNSAVNFLRRLSGRTGVFINEGFPVLNNKGSIQISFDTISNLTINDDESYILKVDNGTILIKAITDVGAIRGLETLLQLTQNNEINYFLFLSFY